MRSGKQGITLISLIITIIILLILAGVSINALVGDNGIINNSMRAKLATELGSYKEEVEFYTIKVNGDDESLEEKKTITAFGAEVKKYIPSMRDNEIGEYAIIGSKLWYLGSDEQIKEVAISQKINVIPEGETKESYSSDLENEAILATIASDGDKLFEHTKENQEIEKVGEPLKDKEGLNATDWKLVTEVVNGVLVATYGTGWTYVPAGSTIDAFGTLENGYVINFKEKKAVKFDSSKHSLVDIDTFVVAKNNLIFNADSSVIEAYKRAVNNHTTFDTSLLGENLDFYGYNATDDEAGGKSNNCTNPDLSRAFDLTNYAFKFDGVNDYIKIKFDDTVLSKEKIKDANGNDTANYKSKKQVLAENGFTFQFYGIMDGRNFIYK